MRVHRIRLTDVRGVGHLDVELAPTGVTLVTGPNEAGKTSLVEALALVLDLPDSSRAARVTAVQPVGSDVGPQVEVDLETGPYRLVVTKRFLRSPLTELRVTAPHPRQWSGREAHDRLQQILAETLDRPLLDALQLAQGTALDQPDLARVEPLRAALGRVDALADRPDAAPDAAGHSELLAAVEAEAARYRTPRTGRPRAELASVVRAERDVRARVDVLAAELADADRLAERQAGVVADLARLDGQLAVAAQLVDDRRGAVRALDSARDAVESAAEQLDKAERQHADAARASAERARLVDAAAERELALQQVRDQLEPARRAADAADGEVADLAEQLAVARSALDRAEASHAGWAGRLELVRAETEAAALARRLQRARAAADASAAATARLRARAFDPAALDALEAATADLDVAERAREAASALVRVEPLGRTAVLADGAPIESGWSRRAVDAVVVEVPGTVRVHVEPGAAGGLDTAVGDARARLDALLVQHAVCDLDAARAAHAEHERLTAERDAAEAELASVLDGGTAGGLASAAEVLDDRLARLRAAPGHGDTDDAPADPTDLAARVDAAAEALRAARAAERDLQLRADRATTTAHAATRAVLGVTRDADHAAQERRRAQGALVHARAVVPDAELSEALVETTDALGRCRAEHLDATAALDAHDPASLDHALAAAEADLDRIARRSRELEDERTGVRARIEAVRERGTWEAHAAALADHDHAERRLAQVTARADAAELLLRTLRHHQQRTRERYVRPFTEAITALGRPVFGDDFAVEVSTDLRVVSRTLGGRTVAFDQLSGGAREQLGVIGRLACAALVGRAADGGAGDAGGGAPVVLDDALGFADPDRLRSLTRVVGHAAGSAQVLVLTCQPDRYADLEAARVVHLDRT